MCDTTEKCNTLRQNLTIQRENRTGHSVSSPVPKHKGVVSPPPWDKTNSQTHHLPTPAERGLIGARAPRTLGGAVRNGVGGSKARGR